MVARSDCSCNIHVSINCFSREMIVPPSNRKSSAKSPATLEADRFRSGRQTSASQADLPRLNLLEQGRILEVCRSGACSRFHALWLRDNGQDANTRDPSNHQKLITLQDIPENTALESASVNADKRLELQFRPDQWRTAIDIDWLWENRYDRQPDCESSAPGRLLPAHISTWDAAFSAHIPGVSWTDAESSPEALLDWLSAVDRYGIAIMHDLPVKDAALLDVIGLFGYVRATNYGPLFEIRAEINPVNLAYTRKGLEPHTDNPYRNPTPGLQFFGCLENNVQGGESALVDGFRIAEILKRENPDWFESLRRYSARFEYRGSDDAHLVAKRPIIQTDADGQLCAIHFNNRSADASTDIPFTEMETWYRACRRFGELAGASRLQVTFKLAPGQLFVTDNTRILHGRTGFSGAGNRWMQGAYADKDSLQSKIRVLKKQLETNRL